MVEEGTHDELMALVTVEPPSQPKTKAQLQSPVDVCCVLDISGSMSLNSGPGVSRIQAAQANLLKVFDEHIYDVDTVGFLPFNHKVVAEQGFEPAKVQVMDRRVMRDSLMRGSSVAKGGTAFWDALVHASEALEQPGGG
mgnify:CR=1 FL=1